VVETAGTLTSVEFGMYYSRFYVHQLMLQCHRCMEHSLHLAAAHVLSHVFPTGTRNIHGMGAGNGDGDGESSEYISDDDSGVAITSGALRKLTGLIKQVGDVGCIRCNYHMF
jgi:hypothetical protein